MSTMMEAAHMDGGQSAGVAPFPPPGMSFTIKRAGGRPLRFEGSELAMAMSYTPAIPYWYEINLYRTVDQRFVAAVRLFHQSPEKQDTVRAWECASVDDAMDRLTGYDAGFDVPVDMDLDMTGMPPAEMAAKALHLQSRIADARHHYQSLVGEFLHDIQAGG